MNSFRCYPEGRRAAGKADERLRWPGKAVLAHPSSVSGEAEGEPSDSRPHRSGEVTEWLERLESRLRAPLRDSNGRIPQKQSDAIGRRDTVLPPLGLLRLHGDLRPHVSSVGRRQGIDHRTVLRGHREYWSVR